MLNPGVSYIENKEKIPQQEDNEYKDEKVMNSTLLEFSAVRNTTDSNLRETKIKGLVMETSCELGKHTHSLKKKLINTHTQKNDEKSNGLVIHENCQESQSLLKNLKNIKQEQVCRSKEGYDPFLNYVYSKKGISSKGFLHNPKQHIHSVNQDNPSRMISSLLCFIKNPGANDPTSITKCSDYPDNIGVQPYKDRNLQELELIEWVTYELEKSVEYWDEYTDISNSDFRWVGTKNSKEWVFPNLVVGSDLARIFTSQLNPMTGGNYSVCINISGRNLGEDDNEYQVSGSFPVFYNKRDVFFRFSDEEDEFTT